MLSMSTIIIKANQKNKWYEQKILRLTTFFYDSLNTHQKSDAV